MTSVKPRRRLDMRGLIAIHQELVTRYGGQARSRSREVESAMLELSLTRAVTFGGDGKQHTYARIAAGYAWALLLNRPFAEGNEQVALAAMVTYLEMNGLSWKCSEAEETAMVLRAAAKEIKEDAWKEWVIRNVGSSRP
jgi:prophage maintenance system killer protein